MLNNPRDFDWNIVGLDFGNWEEEKIWALSIPESELDMADLEWHLDCPFWESDGGVRYSITPRNVIERVAGTSQERVRVAAANTSYPIDIYYNKDKWLILDGIHRLTKLYGAGIRTVRVRIVTEELLPLILTEEPIEMPTWWNQ